MRESTHTKEAVEEWWDVNMTPPTSNAGSATRTLLVGLVEELCPALLLARVFFSAAGEGRLEGLSELGPVRLGLSRRLSSSRLNT